MATKPTEETTTAPPADPPPAQASAPDTSELLKDVPAFDVAADIAALKGTKVQEYGPQQPPTPETPVPDQADPAKPTDPAAKVTPKKQSAEQGARIAVGMFDHIQSLGWSFYAGEDEQDRYRFKDELKAEMQEYVAIGIEEAGGKFKLPWWLPLIVCLIGSFLANFQRARDMRKARKKAEAEELQRLADDAGVGLPGDVREVRAPMGSPLGTTPAQPPMRTAPAQPPMRPGSTGTAADATGGNGGNTDATATVKVPVVATDTSMKEVLCKLPGCTQLATTPGGYCTKAHAASHNNKLRALARKG